MKKLLSLILGLLFLGASTLVLAAKPIDTGQGEGQGEITQQQSHQQTKAKIQKQINEKTQERLELKGERTIQRAETKKIRTEARELRFEEKYSKKTALMTRHFEKKLSIFEEKMSDKILLKVYPIFLDKLGCFLKNIDVDEGNEQAAQRLEFFTAIIELIQEKLTILEEETTIDDDQTIITIK